MLDLTEEVTGTKKLPLFSENVIFDKNIALYMRPLHDAIIEKRDVSINEKEEILLSLISLLLQNCGNEFQNYTPECREEIEKACKYMKQHYTEHVNLEQICRHVGLGKSTLLRAFTKEKSITPYRYLEALRINEAKNNAGKQNDTIARNASSS
jgi:AraC-like DNA-binding protein